jgi:hypothetical protein
VLFPWALRLYVALGLLALPLAAEAQLFRPRVEVSRWAFTATVGQFHTENLYLLSSDGPGDTIDTVSAGLLYGRTTPRYALSAYGRISGNHYWNFSQSSRINYGGGFGASFSPSRTLTLTLGQAGSSGFYAPLLIGLGVQYPGVRADSLRTTLAADWQATPRTLLRVEGDLGYLRYSSEISDLDPSELPLDTLVLSGVLSPEQAEIGIDDLPTPLDSSLVALTALSAEGVRRGSLELLTYRAGLVLTQTLSPKLTLSVPFGYRKLDYSRTDFRDGSQFDTGLSFRRSLGTATSASLQYTYQRNQSQVPPVTTQTFLLQGEHEISSHFKFDASVGVGLTSAGSLPVDSGSSLLGGVGLSGRARRTTWDLRYGRSTYQALGFGRNYLTDYASAYVEQRLAKRLSARLEARYRHSRESLFGAYVFDTQYYGVLARYRIEKRTMASAYYYLRRVDRPVEQDDVSSSLWGFSIGYARSWKP